jgi:endonuclease/exonuclease/phosphatase family metal-dependent hydrolase
LTKRTLTLALVAIASLAAPAGASAAKGDKGEEVTVMSRNIYLGSDLNPAIGAPDLPSAVDGAGQIYNEVNRTNFPERAVALANEIKDYKVDLIGVQEAALWQQQIPSDAGGPPIGPGTVPASDVLYDFRDLLMDQLGNKYRLVGQQTEFTGELPADVDQSDATGSPFGADLDARLTMHDLIIARKGVKTSKVKSANYDTRFSTNIGGIDVFADRGWVSTEATVGDAKFRFVNTHLEAFGDPSIRAAQAKELVKGPAKSKKDVVLVGDMNSDKDDDDGSQKAYEAIRKAGFVERQVGGGTSGHDDSLTDPNDQNQFDRTIDFVFSNNDDIGLVKSKSAITGRDDASVMTPSGLWPSDHAGVVSTLRFP